MSLIAILILDAVLGIAWRLLRLALRVALLVALLVALIAAIANYGSHLARHGHPAPPAVQQRR